MKSLVNYALTYAQLNFKVFPMKVNSKNEQVLKSWDKEATNDIKQIIQWFTNKDYNIGIKTGEGLIVIDVDNINGQNGNQSILPYLNKFPKTRIVKTSNNRFHLYYYVDREIKSKTHLYDGINISGDGSYVIAPPSMIDDKAYIVYEDRPIAKANEMVYDFLNIKPTENNYDDYKITWKSALSMSCAELMESQDIISKFLPIGVTLMAAPAKMGKTFLNMQLANTVACGGDFLGHQCKKSSVYYLAFEDPEHNQIERLKNSSFKIAQGYDIEICPPYQNSFDLEKKILNYLHFNSNLGVVIIDTFEKIRPHSDRTYTVEYKEVTKYHELGLKYDIAIILVMHTIKNTNDVNVFANISGSAGTLAAVDGLMVMLRNRYNEKIKMLYLDGKGIPANTIYLKQDDNMSFYKIEMKDDTKDIDPDLQFIIRYVIENDKYTGSCEKLGVYAKVNNCNGKHIRTLLDNNEDILKSFFISYEVLQRTSKSRQVKLVYYGDECYGNDANDEMTNK